MRPAKVELQIKGYTVFIVQCADGSYYSGLCDNMQKRLKEINSCDVSYFMSKPELVPVQVVFREDQLPFRVAYEKHRCLRKMTRRDRIKLIQTKRWPLGKRKRALIDAI